VIVGPREALSTHRLHLRNVNWLGDGPLADLPHDGLDIYARVRSTRPPLPARLVQEDGHFAVELGEGEAGVAPGQACVFYESEGPGARVLGGGWIGRTERTREAERALGRLMSEVPATAPL
jgi:tRNA-specific 2-thiouridylase